jgi:O-antigen ligase
MFWILVGYMFLFIHRPFEVWPVLAPYRIELVYILITGIVWATVAEKRWLPNPLHWAFFAFAGVVLVSWLASPFGANDIKVTNYLKLFPFYVVLVTTVHDDRALKRIAIGFLAVMFLYMAHSLREYHNGRHMYSMGIERMIGVDQSLNDANSFGGTIVYALPLVVPLWRTAPSGRMRAFLIGYAALSIVCIGLTGSRSAFVTLLLWVMLLVLRKEYRRWIVPTLVVGVLLWAILPTYLQRRFETIINPAAGPQVAQGSAESRLAGFKIGARLWSQYPLLGVGAGAWREASGSRIESHNLYGEVLGETGTLGTLVFAAVVFLFWLNHRRIASDYRQHPDWGEDFLFYLNQALGTALVLLLFEGNFSHNLLRYNWLWYGAFLIIARSCVEKRVREPFVAPVETLAPEEVAVGEGQV